MESDIIVTVVAIYAPNNDSPNFFRNIALKLRDRSEHKVVVGDFNLVMDVTLDRENTFSNNNKALEEVNNMNDEFSLLDTWRVQNGERREFSWKKKGAYPVKASRIDFALISAGLDQMVKNIMYVSSIKTDHRAIYIVIDTLQSERGRRLLEVE